MTFFACLPTIMLAINSVFLAYWINKLSSRITNLEHKLNIKEWLEAIENGESPSDMAYLFQKGFLK